MVPRQIKVQGQFALLNQSLHNISGRRKARLAVHCGLILSMGHVHRRTSIVKNISTVSLILESTSYSADGPCLQLSKRYNLQCKRMWRSTKCVQCGKRQSHTPYKSCSLNHSLSKPTVIIFLLYVWTMGQREVEPLASTDTAQKGKVQVIDLGFGNFTLC